MKEMPKKKKYDAELGDDLDGIDFEEDEEEEEEKSKRVTYGKPGRPSKKARLKMRKSQDETGEDEEDEVLVILENPNLNIKKTEVIRNMYVGDKKEITFDI